MRNFDIEQYMKESDAVYAKRAEIEALADKLTEKGFRNIVMIGIGGTWGEWYPVAHVMRHYTDLPIYLENAAELCVRTDRRFLSRDSLVITASQSGNTKEVVEAIKLCRGMGIETSVITENADSELGRLCDNVIEGGDDEGEHFYLMFFLFGLRLLFNRGEFPDYVRFADQMANLGRDLVAVREQFEERGLQIAQKYHKEPYNIFVGSGVLWGETYLFSMCVLEEMQWVRTKAVTSAEFFHGTLELIEKDVPVFLFKGEDEYRPLDERVERFCRKTTDKLVVIDTKEYELPGIDDEFRVICSPMILTSLASDRLGALYELNTGHSLDIRRYYKQFDY